MGHNVEYRFDWGDGVYSGWSGSSSAAHAWSNSGTYQIKVVGELAFGDDVYANGPARSEYTLSVEVTGDPTSSGCSVGGGAAAAPLALLMLLGLALVRRRK